MKIFNIRSWILFVYSGIFKGNKGGYDIVGELFNESFVDVDDASITLFNYIIYRV